MPSRKQTMRHCRGASAGAPSIQGRHLGPPRQENCRWLAKWYQQGQEANYRLLPPFLGDAGAALEAMVRKFFKNDALAVILP